MNFSINLFDNYQLLSIIFQIFRTFLKPLQAIDWHTFSRVVIELISLQPFHCWTFWPSACRLGKPQIGTTCLELIGLWIFSIFQVCVNPAAILQCSVTDFQCTSFNMHSSVYLFQCTSLSVHLSFIDARPTLSHRCQKDSFWNDLFSDPHIELFNLFEQTVSPLKGMPLNYGPTVPHSCWKANWTFKLGL